MDSIKHLVYSYLIDQGFTDALAKNLNMLALALGLLCIVLIVNFIVRKLLIVVFTQLSKRTKTHFDDLLIANKAPRNVARIVPLLISLQFVPLVFVDFPALKDFFNLVLKVFVIVFSLWIVRSLLHTAKGYFKTLPSLKDKPIDSYIQVFMIFAWVIGIFSAIALITHISFLNFITGLGAASAIIILVFRDTILGFVASIQVSINDMVRIGDWITFEKYGADGDVIEINLATVKVQNFDKTITTIPTYALISDSFKNWRGMTASGGRRIKRALYIKQSGVKYVSDTDVENLKSIQLISSYLETRQSDIKVYNESNHINKNVLLNGRNLTNLGIFRKYLDTYLKNHSGINKDMSIMVRQLAPTTQGIPLEIYAFSADKRWANYEYIMADIFDHAIAALPYFDLEIFELPSQRQEF